MMQLITLAYNTLSNEQSKKQYDATLKGNQSRTSFNNTTTNTNSGYTHAQNTKDFWSFFDEYFYEQYQRRTGQTQQEEKWKQAQREREERIKNAQREREEKWKQAQQEYEERMRQNQEWLELFQQEQEEILKKEKERLMQQREFLKSLDAEYYTINNSEEIFKTQNKTNPFEKIKKKMFKK